MRAPSAVELLAQFFLKRPMVLRSCQAVCCCKGRQGFVGRFQFLPLEFQFHVLFLYQDEVSLQLCVHPFLRGDVALHCRQTHWFAADRVAYQEETGLHVMDFAFCHVYQLTFALPPIVAHDNGQASLPHPGPDFAGHEVGQHRGRDVFRSSSPTICAPPGSWSVARRRERPLR